MLWVMWMMQHNNRYTQSMIRNMWGMISNSNMTLLMQKHTLCEQEHTGDNQQQE